MRENEALIRKLQVSLLEMLKDIDDLCRKHQINYSLSSGSALGAVRHSGFIPWDDDVDIMMLRNEYERFLDIAESELVDYGYTVQREFTKSWPMTYSKIRKNGTAYIENYKPKCKHTHQGIFIDIFPVDNLCDCPVAGGIQWIAYRLVVSKELYKRGYQTTSFLKKAAMLFSILYPERLLIKIIIARKHNGTMCVQSFLGGGVNRKGSIFPRNIFESYTDVTFENAKFSVVADYDLYLRILYGDYMRLPPPEKRIAAAHALMVDLDNSYEKYI